MQPQLFSLTKIQQERKCYNNVRKLIFNYDTQKILNKTLKRLGLRTNISLMWQLFISVKS